jgi:hypothetical protein
VPRIHTLPAGSRVYHGTADWGHWLVPEGQQWVTDLSEAAAWFARRQGADPLLRVIAFETRRPLRLLELHEDLGSRAFMREIGQALRLAESDLPYPADLRTAAHLVCKHRLDGWTAPGDGGGADILLCHADRVLRPVDIEWLAEPPEEYRHWYEIALARFLRARARGATRRHTR